MNLKYQDTQLQFFSEDSDDEAVEYLKDLEGLDEDEISYIQESEDGSSLDFGGRINALFEISNLCQQGNADFELNENFNIDGRFICRLKFSLEE